MADYCYHYNISGGSTTIITSKIAYCPYQKYVIGMRNKNYLRKFPINTGYPVFINFGYQQFMF